MKFLLVLALVATGCSEDAQKDVRQAAEALGRNNVAQAGAEVREAAEKTNEVAKEKLEVAEDKLEVAEEKLEAAGGHAVDAVQTAKELANPEAAERKAAAAIACEGATCTIERDEYDKLIGNPILLASQVTLKPEPNAGITRWRVEDVREGSLCAQLGIEKQDLLVKINGKTVDNPPHEGLLDELKSAKTLELEIDRNGEKIHREIRPE